MKITEKIQTQICELAPTRTKTEISRLLGVSYFSVSGTLKRKGINAKEASRMDDINSHKQYMQDKYFRVNERENWLV